MVKGFEKVTILAVTPPASDTLLINTEHVWIWVAAVIQQAPVTPRFSQPRCDSFLAGRNVYFYGTPLGLDVEE